MKYIVIFQLVITTLFAHGKEHEHLHFFSSLHAEYFVMFIASLICGYLIYSLFYKGSR
ncbi:hypothetical protein [Sulfurimonas sp.]|jgi:hypothetical protein|uniref:hypothetical protein n=1 Tax=Sulfurimonas sp. TaxID=2022749 RepID=UPI002A36753C|nr:hypothetical protein [Sulfurimonas sp.]MDY0123213.1 hypothetical protein [Sulfurimonas sp.]